MSSRPERGPEGAAERAAELAAGLHAVEQRVRAACAAAGRDREELTLVVVTKTFPARDVRLLASLGVTDVGENRDQEASVKHEACRDLGLTWHFVGQLQTNKAPSVAGYADWVHSADRAKVVRALSRGATRAGRELQVLVQVSLETDAAREEARGGAAPEVVPDLAALVAGSPGLTLRGVMAVAPVGADPRAAFEALAAVADRVRADHPAATAVSAGMSGDLEAAVDAGATHLRVGSAILGKRPPLQ